jgi:hypothetical protein
MFATISASAERPLRVGLLGAARTAPKALLQPAAQRDDVRVIDAAYTAAGLPLRGQAG